MISKGHTSNQLKHHVVLPSKVRELGIAEQASLPLRASPCHCIALALTPRVTLSRLLRLARSPRLRVRIYPLGWYMRWIRFSRSRATWV